MTKKNLKAIRDLKYEDLTATNIWQQLSDFQKTKILLQSSRLADQEEFLEEFGSFQQPDCNAAFIRK